MLPDHQDIWKTGEVNTIGNRWIAKCPKEIESQAVEVSFSPYLFREYILDSDNWDDLTDDERAKATEVGLDIIRVAMKKHTDNLNRLPPDKKQLLEDNIEGGIEEMVVVMEKGISAAEKHGDDFHFNDLSLCFLLDYIIEHICVLQNESDTEAFKTSETVAEYIGTKLHRMAHMAYNFGLGSAMHFDINNLAYNPKTDAAWLTSTTGMEIALKKIIGCKDLTYAKEVARLALPDMGATYETH
jgi:hypothetical protein